MHEDLTTTMSVSQKKMIQRLNALTVIRMQDGKKYAKSLYNSVSIQPQLPARVAQLGMQKV